MTADSLITLEQRVSALVENVIADADHFLVSASVRGVRGSRVVEIFVDGDDGISVDALAKYSREISFLLDTEDFIDGHYKLQVSSPGLDQPLVQGRQYKKHIDRKLKVKIQKEEGNRFQTGVLARIDEASITLLLPNKQSVEIAFSDILESKVVLPW